ncbi:multidrug resistance protein mrp-7-like [Haemaphysalis longicornis]
MHDALELSSGLEDTVSCLLKWTLIGMSLLPAIELTQTVQKQSSVRRWPVCITICDIFYVLFSLFTAALYISYNALLLVPGAILNTDFAVGVSIVWIIISAVCQRWRGFCASNLHPLLHACFFVAVFTDLLLRHEGLAAYRIIPREPHDEVYLETALCSMIAFTALGSFLCACFRTSPVLDKSTAQVNKAADEETLSPLARLVGLAAITHIVNFVRRAEIVQEDIRPNVTRLKCRLLVNRLYSSLKPDWSGANAGTRITIAFLRVLWCEALWMMLTGFAYFASLIIRVPLFEAMIDDIANKRISTVMMLFIAACAAEVCLAGFVEYLARRLGVQLKFLTQAALFSKMTRMSASALSEAPAGHLVSMVAADAEKLNIAVILFSRDITGVLCLPVLMWMLATRVGVLPVAGCVGWMLFTMVLYLVASKHQSSLFKIVKKWRDERLRKMADTLSCVRLVKFYAWEDDVADVMRRYRQKEGSFLFGTNMFGGFLDSVQNSSCSMMTVIVFGTLVAMGESAKLTPEHTFSFLYVLSIVEIPLINMAANLHCRSMAWQGLKKIAKTLTAEERNQDGSTKDDSNFKADQDNRNEYFLNKGTVLLIKCKFSWSGLRHENPAEGEIAINDVNLGLTPGSLVGVVGLVGSGKSALLEAILGELPRHRGTMHVCGRVAYVPQAACIFSMSIRDNVLFGKAMEPLRYTQVLEACELTSDLAKLPAGDLTEVGEKATIFY